MIYSHNYGNYIPASINTENLSVEQLKNERAFLKFIIHIKYQDVTKTYLNRLFYYEPKKDPIIMWGNENCEVWKLPIDELQSLIDGLSLEIVRRNKNRNK